MAPGQDWIIADIDDDAIAAAEAAARAAALSVDDWMRRAIIETYRREALTPPVKVPAAVADRAPVAASPPSPKLAAEADTTEELEPSPAASSAEPSTVPAPTTPSRPAATVGEPSPQPYQPISPATVRVIRVGRLAVGVLLLVVVAAIAWNNQDLWQRGEPTTTAESSLATLPTEQIPVRPAHEAPDPQETERAFAERQAAASKSAEPDVKPGVAKTDAATVDEKAAAEAVAATAETKTRTAAGEEPVTDPAAVPESEAPAASGEPEAAAVEIANADPFAADPHDAERMPETGTVGPIPAPAKPGAVGRALRGDTASGSAIAMRTPPPSARKSDVPDSIAAFIEAAEAGDPDAQHDLALIYIQGLGVPRDPEAAAYWFGQAAQQGNANAQYNLGVMYEQGLGVPQDRIEALLLYLTAAEQGHVAAQYNAGLAYAEGDSVPRDFTEAYRWFLAAAEQGLAEAQYNLGIIYENGLGRPKDDIAAYRYYSLAAQSGHDEAARKLAAVSARLTPAQRAEAEQAAAADAPPPGVGEVNNSRLDREGIREVQRLLKTLGYDTGTADGLSGGRTTAAIREYQQSAGLLVDGKPTAALLEHLRDAAER